MFEWMSVVTECSGHCPAMMRLVATMNYFHSLASEALGDFIEFCDAQYGPKWMMEDYVHCIREHSDTSSKSKMAAALECSCSDGLSQCAVTARHYRDRNCDEQSVHFYVEIIDTMHFNVLHLADVGLGFDVNSRVHGSDMDDNLVDGALAEMSREILKRRRECSFQRIDATAKYIPILLNFAPRCQRHSERRMRARALTK